MIFSRLACCHRFDNSMNVEIWSDKRTARGAARDFGEFFRKLTMDGRVEPGHDGAERHADR
jgi:hypothetical protein